MLREEERVEELSMGLGCYRLGRKYVIIIYLWYFSADTSALYYLSTSDSVSNES